MAAWTIVSLQALEISEQMKAQVTANYAFMGTKGTRRWRNIWVEAAGQYLIWRTFPASETQRLKVFLIEVNIKFNLLEMKVKLRYY